MSNYKNNGATAPSWAPTTPSILNVALTAADTEYSQALPNGTKRFAVSVMDGIATDNLRFAYATGKVATPTAPYMKMPQNIEYVEENVNLDTVTIYLASSAAGKTAQIICWL